MSELKKKYERILDERVQKCMTDDCLEDMVKEVFKIPQLEETLSVIKRIFPDRVYDIESDEIRIPPEKKKTFYQILGSESLDKIVETIPENAYPLMDRYVAIYDATSSTFYPKKRLKLAQENMTRIFKYDNAFNAAIYDLIPLSVFERYSAQKEKEPLNKAFERYLSQNRPKKGDTDARKDYNKLKTTTKRVLAQLQKLQRGKGGLRTEDDVDKVMGVIREGLEGKRERRDKLKDREEIEDGPTEVSADKVIGIYPITDKLQFRISNHPIDLFTVGESQVWTKSACTSYKGCAPWNDHLSADIKWNNIVVYLERQKDGKVYARASMRWCIIPLSDYRSAEAMLNSILNTNHPELGDVLFNYHMRMKKKFKESFTRMHPKDKDNFVVDPTGEYNLAQHLLWNPLMKFAKMKLVKRNDEFVDEMLERMGYLSYGIEPIWYNIGFDNTKALKNRTEGGCGGEQRKMGMEDDCLMALNIAPNFAGYQATIALVNVIKSRGFQTSYATCNVPYYFKGYSDEQDGQGRIEYQSVAKRYGDGKEGMMTMDELYKLFTEFIREETKFTTRCPSCRGIIEWIAELSFEAYLDAHGHTDIPKYIFEQFYNSYLGVIKYNTIPFRGKEELVNLYPYSVQGNMQYGVSRGRRCRFCKIDLNQAGLANYLEYTIEPIINKHFEAKGQAREYMISNIRADILSGSKRRGVQSNIPRFKLSWIRIDERLLAEADDSYKAEFWQLLYESIDEFSSAPEVEKQKEDRLKILIPFAEPLGIKRKKIITAEDIRAHIQNTLWKNTDKIGITRCPLCNSIQGWTIRGFESIDSILLNVEAYSELRRKGKFKDKLHLTYAGKAQAFPIDPIKELSNNVFGVYFNGKCLNCGLRTRTNNINDFAFNLIDDVLADIWKVNRGGVFDDPVMYKEFSKLKDEVVKAIRTIPIEYPHISISDLNESKITPEMESIKEITDGHEIIVFPVDADYGELINQRTMEIAERLGFIRPMPLRKKEEYPNIPIELEVLLPIRRPSTMNRDLFNLDEIESLKRQYGDIQIFINQIKEGISFPNEMIEANITAINEYNKTIFQDEDSQSSDLDDTILDTTTFSYHEVKALINAHLPLRNFTDEIIISQHSIESIEELRRLKYLLLPKIDEFSSETSRGIRYGGAYVKQILLNFLEYNNLIDKLKIEGQTRITQDIANAERDETHDIDYPEAIRRLYNVLPIRDYVDELDFTLHNEGTLSAMGVKYSELLRKVEIVTGNDSYSAVYIDIIINAIKEFHENLDRMKDDESVPFGEGSNINIASEISIPPLPPAFSELVGIPPQTLITPEIEAQIMSDYGITEKDLDDDDDDDDDKDDGGYHISDLFG